MVRITIKLIDVVCNQKESAFLFHDKFYTMTTFSDPDKNPKADVHTQSQLSVPLDITSGQDLPMPHSPFTVFDQVVPQHSEIKGGLTAYNDEQGLGWGHIDSWIASIALSVGNGLIKKGILSGSWEVVAAGAVIDLAVVAWYALVNLSDSTAHQLGEKPLVFLSDGLSSEDLTWHFFNTGGLGGNDSWDYTLKYQITRSLVAG